MAKNSLLELYKKLFSMSGAELKEFYKLLKKNRDELSQRLAKVMFDYNITDDNMNISESDKKKLYAEMSREINKNIDTQSKLQITLAENILKKSISEVTAYWNYNIGFEEVRKIINSNFKGKHFSTRVWDNEEEVAKRLNKKINDFLDGKVGVNQIKRDIEELFNTSAFNARRIVETEVTRCSNDSFFSFCEETGVKKLKYIATLDFRTNPICEASAEKIYSVEDAPRIPRHPFCRCYYDIVE